MHKYKSENCKKGLHACSTINVHSTARIAAPHPVLAFSLAIYAENTANKHAKLSVIRRKPLQQRHDHYTTIDDDTTRRHSLLVYVPTLDLEETRDIASLKYLQSVHA